MINRISSVLPAIGPGSSIHPTVTESFVPFPVASLPTAQFIQEVYRIASERTQQQLKPKKREAVLCWN